MPKTEPFRDVVLLGIGHTNAHILQMWRTHPPAGVRLTCISDEPIATYSGMLPGVLAAQYPPDRMEIDLVRLTAVAAARLVVGEVTGVDVAGQALHVEGAPPLRFDVLSIGIGSTPNFDGVRVVDGGRLLPIKPMQRFLPRLDERLRQAAAGRAGQPLRIAVVGGGAGGIEIALCLFAVGDTGTIAGASVPKAGVYAVRQGPILWDNIQRTLRGAPLRPYKPQRRFLRLLNTGDGRAIAEWRGLSFEGAWCWWLKDAIDSRFMKPYQDFD